MGIKTVADLIFHFPFRYEDFSQIRPIKEIKPNEENCLAGKILEIKISRTWKKKLAVVQALITDQTAATKAVWFNQPYLVNVLKEGDWVCLAGKAVFDKRGIYLSNPVFEKLPNPPDSRQSPSSKIDTSPLAHTGRIVPVYPETAGLSSRWLRNLIKPLLWELKNKLSDPLPLAVIKKNGLMPLRQAIWQVHFPDSLAKAEAAKQRFSFEELFLLELAVLKQKLALSREKAPAIPLQMELMKKFVSLLPFKLTAGQKKCAWQILKDMEKPRPMSRLLQGEVGSGKTVVAVMAALNAIKAGWQVVFMAPTEILAKQHFAEVSKLLWPFKIKVALLTGREDKINSLKLKNESIEISRQKILDETRNGKIPLLIGTHTLLQNKVKFQKLALCIIDEQHRFGVEQRARLAQPEKNESGVRQLPHFLSMTATPIPRSLALTIYGDLDLSVLDEMPQGRKKVLTAVVPPEKRKETYEFIRQRVKKGEQVFVICPRIEKSEETDAAKQNSSLTAVPKTSLPDKKNGRKKTSWEEVKAVKEEYEKLSKEIFPDLRVAMLHGRMKSKEKEKIMKMFRAKKLDILVSTSVVEVGIDIPHATVMVIEGAERFGLAQLHQFRGRIGRSHLQSYCFLFTDSESKKTSRRLKAILKAKDGFELAQKDLEIRGPGSLSGAKQWGLPDLLMENLKNLSLVTKAREAAKEILAQDADLKSLPFLAKKLAAFQKNIHLE